jgi:hypothetical protein
MAKLKKKPSSKKNKEENLPKKKIFKIKNKSINAFNSVNYRRRKKGLKELSYQEYISQKVALDSSGRFHPRKENAKTKAVVVFGKEILEKRKSCIKCKKKKKLIEFSMRYSKKIILNVCKECEQERQKKYWKV